MCPVVGIEAQSQQLINNLSNLGTDWTRAQTRPDTAFLAKTSVQVGLVLFCSLKYKLYNQTYPLEAPQSHDLVAAAKVELNRSVQPHTHSL